MEEVRELIDRKDFVAVEQVINRHKVSEDLKALILDLPRLFGNKDILARISETQSVRRHQRLLTTSRKYWIFWRTGGLHDMFPLTWAWFRVSTTTQELCSEVMPMG